MSVEKNIVPGAYALKVDLDQNTEEYLESYGIICVKNNWIYIYYSFELKLLIPFVKVVIHS